eukprot:6753750-Karenia_brevis.AAC.1
MRKKRALNARMREGTWVGFHEKTNEHIVVLRGGGPAVLVRTVRPVSDSERWSKQAIEEIIATPDRPNPKNPQQQRPRTERETVGLDFGISGGDQLPKVSTQRQEDQPRDFKITKQ